MEKPEETTAPDGKCKTCIWWGTSKLDPSPKTIGTCMNCEDYPRVVFVPPLKVPSGQSFVLLTKPAFGCNRYLHNECEGVITYEKDDEPAYCSCGSDNCNRSKNINQLNQFLGYTE